MALFKGAKRVAFFEQVLSPMKATRINRVKPDEQLRLDERLKPFLDCRLRGVRGRPMRARKCIVEKFGLPLRALRITE